MNQSAQGAAAPFGTTPLFLRNDIRLLGKTLGQVIKECEGKATYDVVEKLRQAAVKFRREGDLKSGKILVRQIERLAAGNQFSSACLQLFLRQYCRRPRPEPAPAPARIGRRHAHARQPSTCTGTPQDAGRGLAQGTALSGWRVYCPGGESAQQQQNRA